MVRDPRRTVAGCARLLVAVYFLVGVAPRVHAEASAASPSDPPRAATPPRFSPTDYKHALGVYARYLFVTELMFKPYVDHSTSLQSYDVGLQYTRRYASFEVVTSLDFSWFGVTNGNWLGRGNDPTLDTKYVEFDKLSALSVDVALIGHHAFTRWLEIKGGAGLGIGYVFGDVYTTHNSNQVCTAANAGDTSKCYPISPTAGPIYLNQPDTAAKLRATEDATRKSTAGDPHRTKEFKPPAIPVLNIMMALNFRLQRHISAQIEVGFRNAMFVGAGIHFPL